jgi:hypothetical protein
MLLEVFNQTSVTRLHLKKVKHNFGVETPGSV